MSNNRSLDKVLTELDIDKSKIPKSTAKLPENSKTESAFNAERFDPEESPNKERNNVNPPFNLNSSEKKPLKLNNIDDGEKFSPIQSQTFYLRSPNDLAPRRTPVNENIVLDSAPIYINSKPVVSHELVKPPKPLSPPLTSNQIQKSNGNTPKVNVVKKPNDYIVSQKVTNSVRVLSGGQIFNKKFSVKIMGVGGAGNNIIKHIYCSRQWPDFVEVIALNTDYNALNRITEITKNKYLIGVSKLDGNGAGGDPSIASEAISEDIEVIKNIIKGTDILILLAGLGKGTGSGATPEIAKIAIEMGILTIGMFNLPSIGAEGEKTYSNALEYLEKLHTICNGYTAISNDRVIGVDRERTSIKKAYDDANEYFKTIINEFIDMITVGVDVNIDFSDIKQFFKNNSGFVFIKTSVSDYSKDSIKNSIENSLQHGYTDIDITDSHHVLCNFKINENVPSIILENARTAIKEIVKTNDLHVVTGISFSDIHESAGISMLIAGKYDLSENFNSSNNYFYPVGPEVINKKTIIAETKVLPVDKKNKNKNTEISNNKQGTNSIESMSTAKIEDFSFVAPTKELITTSTDEYMTSSIPTEEILTNSYLKTNANENTAVKTSVFKKVKNLFSKQKK